MFLGTLASESVRRIADYSLNNVEVVPHDKQLDGIEVIQPSQLL